MLCCVQELPFVQQLQPRMAAAAQKLGVLLAEALQVGACCLTLCALADLAHTIHVASQPRTTLCCTPARGSGQLRAMPEHTSMHGRGSKAECALEGCVGAAAVAAGQRCRGPSGTK